MAKKKFDPDKDPMKAEVKGYKTFTGHDGQGYECSLYLNDQRVGTMFDPAYGGGAEFQDADFRNQDLRALFAEFMHRCRALPPVEVKPHPDWGMPENWSYDQDWESWVKDNLLPIAHFKKELRGRVGVIYKDQDGDLLCDTYNSPKWAQIKDDPAMQTKLMEHFITHNPDIANPKIVNNMKVVGEVPPAKKS